MNYEKRKTIIASYTKKAFYSVRMVILILGIHEFF